MTSPASASLVSLESKLAKFSDHRSSRNSYINSYMDNLEKTELTTSICHIAIFLKSGIRFRIPKFQMRLAEKQEEEVTEEEVHRILPSVMRTRKGNNMMFALRSILPLNLSCNGQFSRYLYYLKW